MLYRVLVGMRLNNSVFEDLEDFCVILGTGLVEDHKMMRGKLIDGKEL